MDNPMEMHNIKNYECRDLESHLAFLEGRNVFLRPVRGPTEKHFRTTFAARFLGNAYVARVRYGYAATVEKTAHEWSWHHVISMPVKGSMQSTVNGRETIADSDRFVVRSPAIVQQFETTAQTEELFLALDPSYLRTFCARLIGRPLPTDIIFAPELSPLAPHARAIRLTGELCLNDVCNAEPEATRQFEVQFQEFIASALLLHQPHNYSDELSGRASPPAPRDVKRVMDYIHANLHDVIRLEDLITVANVPGRTLNEHFRRFLNQSPMAYVKHQRLKLARGLLMKQEIGTVTEIATHCGFYHLGRFSIDYARAFGESPSATRGRRVGSIEVSGE